MSGAHSSRRRRRLWPWAVLVLAVVAVPAGQAMLGIRAQSDQAEAGPEACVTTTRVRLVVARPMLEPASRGAEEISETCREVSVSAMSSATVLRIFEFDQSVPDLWIPDSRAWQMQLVGDDVPISEVRRSVASTPVLMVGGPEARVPDSWHDALVSGRMDLPDPLDDGVGAMALLSVRPELEREGLSSQQIYQELVPLAQGYGASRDGRADEVSVDTVSGDSTGLVAATEQEYLAALADHPELEADVPASGAPTMDFPLYAAATASPAARQAGEELAMWFASGDGVAALHEAGLRSADGEAPHDEVGEVAELSIPWQFAQAADLDTWRKLGMPSSVLAVFDASGSMDFAAGGRTRMGLAVEVARTALGIFPDPARIGLWVFSSDQGGPGQDWRVLEPMRRLDAQVRGTTQRAQLQARTGQMLDLTQGGTGLYDTTLAAYRQALRDYHPAYSNSVILLTDGSNDDPGSIPLDRLLERLEQARDPERPVRIIGIAVSQEADHASLRRIAQATGGKAYRALDPQDILEVFARAISTR